MGYEINMGNIKMKGVREKGNIDVGGSVEKSDSGKRKYFGAKFWLGDVWGMC